MSIDEKVEQRKQSLENEYYNAVGKTPPTEREGGVDLELESDLPDETMEEGKIRCPVNDCHVICHNENGLAVHLKMIHDLVPCPYCKGNYKNGRGILRHVSTGHKKKLAEFKRINYPLKDEIVEAKEHECKFPGCNRSFDTPRGLRRHEHVHEEKIVKKKRGEKTPGKEKKEETKRKLRPYLGGGKKEKKTFPTEFEAFVDNFFPFLQENKADVVELQWKKEGKRRFVTVVYDEG